MDKIEYGINMAAREGVPAQDGEHFSPIAKTFMEMGRDSEVSFDPYRLTIVCHQSDSGVRALMTIERKEVENFLNRHPEMRYDMEKNRIIPCD